MDLDASPLENQTVFASTRVLIQILIFLLVLTPNPALHGLELGNETFSIL